MRNWDLHLTWVVIFLTFLVLPFTPLLASTAGILFTYILGTVGLVTLTKAGDEYDRRWWKERE